MKSTIYITSSLNSIWPKKLQSESYFTSDPYCRYIILQKKLIDDKLIDCGDYLKKDREEMQNASIFVQKKYDKYIPILSSKLNHINEVDYSITFWKKYLSQALIRQITILHDIFTRTKINIDPENQRFNILSLDSYIYTNTNEEQFDLLVSSEFGQEMLFSIYINLFHPNSQEHSIILQKSVKIKQSNNENVIKKKAAKIFSFFYFTSFKYKLQIFFLKLYKFVNSYFKRKVLVAFIDVFYAERYQLKLLKTGGFKLNFINPILIDFKDTLVNKSKRKKLTELENINYPDDFDKFFFYSLQYLLPTSFIENFKKFENKTEETLSKYPNLKHVISEGWQSNTYTSFMLAYCHYKNINHFYSEHTGFFHIYDGNVVEQKSRISDFYLTTGWKNSKIKNLIPLASLYNYNVIGEIKNVKGYEILYITNSNEARMYQYGGFYSTMEVNSFKHMEFIKLFFDNLNNDVLKKLYIREHPIEYQKKRLCFDKNYFCGINYNKAKRAESDYTIGNRAKDQILYSKLIIVDSISTSYLESLFMNKPLIFFLNLKTNYLNNENQTFFDDLISAKICWTCPKGAANFVNSLHLNIDLWWNSEIVQTARVNFLKQNFQKPNSAISFYKDLILNH